MPSGLVAFNLMADQEPYPSIDCGPIAGPIIFDVDHLAVTTAAGEIIVADVRNPPPPKPPPPSPRPRRHDSWPQPPPATTAASQPALPKIRKINHIPGAITSVPPILVDDALLYYTKGSIQRYDLQTGNKTEWAKITSDFPGTLTTPMVMMSSHLFFATDREGFVCFKPQR